MGWSYENKHGCVALAIHDHAKQSPSLPCRGSLRFIQGYIYQMTGRSSSIAKIRRYVQNLKNSGRREVSNRSSRYNVSSIREDSPSSDNASQLRICPRQSSFSSVKSQITAESCPPFRSLSMSQRRLASNIPALKSRVIMPPLHPILSSMTSESAARPHQTKSPMHLSFKKLSLFTTQNLNLKTELPATPLDQISHDLPAPPCIPRFPSPKPAELSFRNSSHPNSLCNSPVLSAGAINTPLSMFHGGTSLPSSSSRFSVPLIYGCSTPVGASSPNTISPADDHGLTVKPHLVITTPAPPIVNNSSKARTCARTVRLGLGPRRLSYRRYTHVCASPLSPKSIKPGLDSPFIPTAGTLGLDPLLATNFMSAVDPNTRLQVSSSSPVCSALNGYFPWYP